MEGDLFMHKKNGITDANAAPTNDNMTDQAIENARIGMAEEESFAAGANMAGVNDSLVEREAKRSIGQQRTKK
jgi:hypothetical protein